MLPIVKNKNMDYNKYIAGTLGIEHASNVFIHLAKFIYKQVSIKRKKIDFLNNDLCKFLNLV